MKAHTDTHTSRSVGGRDQVRNKKNKKDKK